MTTMDGQLFDDEDWLYGENSSKDTKSQQSDTLSNRTLNE